MGSARNTIPLIALVATNHRPLGLALLRAKVAPFVTVVKQLVHLVVVRAELEMKTHIALRLETLPLVPHGRVLTNQFGGRSSVPTTLLFLS